MHFKTDAGKSGFWLCKPFKELGLPCKSSTRISEDNAAGMKWSKDTTTWPRTCHFDTKYNTIKVLVESEQLDMEYCPINSMWEGLLTSRWTQLSTDT